jgi:hypothetical protein
MWNEWHFTYALFSDNPFVCIRGGNLSSQAVVPSLYSWILWTSDGKGKGKCLVFNTVINSMECNDDLQTSRQPDDIHTTLSNAIWCNLIRTNLTYWFKDSFLNSYSEYAWFETDRPKGLSEWVFLKPKPLPLKLLPMFVFHQLYLPVLIKLVY